MKRGAIKGLVSVSVVRGRFWVISDYETNIDIPGSYLLNSEDV